MKQLDITTAHDIVHRANGNTAAKCPYCAGEMTDNQCTEEANRLVKEAVQRGANVGSMMYSEEEKKGKELSSKKRDNLKDSQFAYVDENGVGHLPIPDAAHVRNALARFNQTDMPESAKAGAMAKIKRAAAKFGVTVSEDDKKASEEHENFQTFTDLFTYMKADELPGKIQVMPIGKFNTLKYGELEITANDIQDMANNFNTESKAGTPLRAGVPIDVDHDGGKAAGWIRQLTVANDGLYANVEWTKYGEELLKNKEYRFLSPEFDPNYTDPEHADINVKNVLIAASLVNRPLFKELKPLVASEDLTKVETHEKVNSDMKLDEVRAKDPQTISADEKDFLKKNVAELSPAEKIAFGLVKADDKKKADDEEMEEEKKKDDETKKASEKGKEDKVSLTASEYAGLISMKDELETKKLADEVKAWEFDETDGGKVLPKTTDKIVSFMKTLNASQRTAFSEIMDEVPDKGAAMFSEAGAAEVKAGSKTEVIQKKAEKIVADEKAAGKNITMGDAVKRVLAAEPELASRQDDLVPVESKL